MNTEPALKALDEMILSEVTDSRDPGRYGRIGRLCGLASKLATMYSRRIDNALAIDGKVPAIDQALMGDDEVGVNEEYGQPYRMALPRVNQQGDILREMMVMIPQVIKSQSAVAPEVQMERLLNLRDRLTRDEDAPALGVVQARLAELTLAGEAHRALDIPVIDVHDEAAAAAEEVAP